VYHPYEQEALETHKEAYAMRVATLGETNGETAMSLNQVRDTSRSSIRNANVAWKPDV
jgi:hypothetical protein